MNYTVSIYADRAKGKAGFVLFLDGSVLSEKVVSFKNEGLKEKTLHCIYMGIKECVSKVHHNDILTIEAPNVYICQWLNGMVESEGYVNQLGKIFNVIENLDCRYVFRYAENPLAKRYISKAELTRVKVTSAVDLLSEFE